MPTFYQTPPPLVIPSRVPNKKRTNKAKARSYLAKGKCLFRRLGQMSHSEAISKTLAEVESAIAD